MSVKSAEHYKQYRAPTENGEILCDPQWQSLADLVAENQQQGTKSVHNLFGQSLTELAEQARKSVLQTAIEHTQSYADVEVPESCNAPWIVTGHQPDFVHSGVWLKNFAAAQLARMSNGIAISLIIDNDLCRTSSILVPTGTIEQPRVESVAYDRAFDHLPFEERRINDISLWTSFADRTTETLKPLIEDPLLSEWWQQSVLSHDSKHLGLALAEARHRIELQWGSNSLEIPQSRVCQSDTFRWFAIHLLSEAENLRTAFNQSLAKYRQVHRLRNHAQPLPDLIKDEDWIETPFWIWNTKYPQRRALYVKRLKNELLISDRREFNGTLPINSSDDCSAAIDQLMIWESQGIKLRTRALLTTMFARLFLADLFIHGIGGAKYDQVTDDICHRFFGFVPPTYVTISGTLHLPIDHPHLSAQSQVEIRRQLREITFHPEVELSRISLEENEQSQVDCLEKEKISWIETEKTLENAAKRHQGICSANLALQRWLAPRRLQLEQELADSEQRIRANRLLESREYPFCLFPRNTLRNFLLDFSSRMP